jgi:hypothetical protein
MITLQSGEQWNITEEKNEMDNWARKKVTILKVKVMGYLKKRNKNP